MNEEMLIVVKWILFVYLEYFIGRVLEECREKCLNVWWLCGYLDVLCKFLKILFFNFYIVYFRFFL